MVTAEIESALKDFTPCAHHKPITTVLIDYLCYFVAFACLITLPHLYDSHGENHYNLHLTTQKELFSLSPPQPLPRQMEFIYSV
jgi:hypothetical protein